jgi:hypothetical protein
MDYHNQNRQSALVGMEPPKQVNPMGLATIPLISEEIAVHQQEAAGFLEESPEEVCSFAASPSITSSPYISMYLHNISIIFFHLK